MVMNLKRKKKTCLWREESKRVNAREESYLVSFLVGEGK
jgi:hypothetical protein